MTPAKPVHFRVRYDPTSAKLATELNGDPILTRHRNPGRGGTGHAGENQIDLNLTVKRFTGRIRGGQSDFAAVGGVILPRSKRLRNLVRMSGQNSDIIFQTLPQKLPRSATSLPHRFGCRPDVEIDAAIPRPMPNTRNS
jgi:hypothetical protein